MRGMRGKRNWERAVSEGRGGNSAEVRSGAGSEAKDYGRIGQGEEATPSNLGS